MSLNSLINSAVNANSVTKTLTQKVRQFRLGHHRNLHFATQCSNKPVLKDTNPSETTSEPNAKPPERDKFRNRLLNGPNLKDFFKNENLKNQENIPEEEVVPYLQNTNRSLSSEKSPSTNPIIPDMDKNAKCTLKSMVAR